MAEIEIDHSKKLISKTDKKGRVMKVNDYFVEISGFSEEESIGKPHNYIRHEDMPKLVFRLLWVKLRFGMEVNAFVKNSTKQGHYYWVYATVSPTFDSKTNEIKAYYSIRKKANPEAVEVMKSFYEKLHEVENTQGKGASKAYLKNFLDQNGMKFNDLMGRLQAQGSSFLKI